MDRGNTTCDQCDRQIDDSLTWCPYCGAEQHPAESRSQPSDEISSGIDAEAPGSAVDPFAVTTRASRPGGRVGAPPTGSAPWSGGSRAAIIGLGVLVLVAAVGAWLLFLRDDNRGDLSVMRTAAGDCWNDPDGFQADTELFDIPEVPCEEAHDNEVFATIELTGGDRYPGDFNIQIDAFQGCLARFDAFVGVGFIDSPLDIYTLFPTEESWSEGGDRGVICSIYMLDGSTMTGSIEGVGARLPGTSIDVDGLDDCPGVADRAVVVAQRYIDYFEALTTEELEAGFETFDASLQRLYKSESLVAARASTLECDFNALNILVMNRAGLLTFTTDFGQSFADDIATYGFFTTE